MFLQPSQDIKFIDSDARGNPLMTLKTLKYYCLKENIQLVPPPVKLYLHYKNFTKIESLKQISTELQSLWLNNNSILKIQNLQENQNLISLYLNNNIIQKIENLHSLINLKVLNLSHNKIQKIDNLKCLTNLNNIDISHNFLSNEGSIVGLTQCPTLTNINLSHNDITNSEKNSECLYLKSTPINRAFKNYRKRLIFGLKKLKFLDDRPVQEEDHRLAQAWMKGGSQLQQQQKQKIFQEKEQKQKKLQQEERAKHQEQKLMREEIMKQRKLPLQQRIIQLKKIEEKNPQELKQLNRLTKKLQDLSNPKPKSFLASVKNNQIKIMNIDDEQEQQQIINQYFSKEKEQVQKRKATKEKERQQKIQSDEKYEQEYLKQLQNMIDQQNIPENFQESIKYKWNRKYQPLLEALLEKYRFDFSEVQPSFNMILSDINKKMVRPHQRFQIKQLRLIWTQVQIRRRKQ